MNPLVFGALGACILIGATPAIAAEEKGDVQAGFEYADTYCAGCHGARRSRCERYESLAKRFQICKLRYCGLG